MRSQKVVLALGLIALVGAALLLSACSSDDTPTSRSSTINLHYPEVVAEVNQLIDSSLAAFATTLEMFEGSRALQDGTDLALREFMMSSFDLDSVTTEGMWYITWNADLQTSLASVQIDSILFLEDGAPTLIACHADGMRIKRIWEVASFNTDESHTDYQVISEFRFSGLDTDQATITGTVNAIVQDVTIAGTSTTTMGYVIDAGFTGLVVDATDSEFTGGCPASGTCAVEVELTYQKDAGDEWVSSWDFAFSFTDGAVQGTVTDSRVDSVYTQTFCTP
jgi:hypothetical protein